MLDLLKLAPSTKMNGEKADALGMITPYNIVTDMNKLITEHIENHKNNKNIWDFKFLDIACKSGNFLRAMYKWLMNHPDMINKFEKESDRHSHIVQKQIFGVCFRETDMLIANRNTFGTIELNSHIKYIYNWQDKVKLKSLTEIQETLKETLGQMKFDVVVGNPPYNSDIYLDFVTKAHGLIDKESESSCVCMITPAKWQAKTDGKPKGSSTPDKNEDFRKNIVPYMNKIVMYKDSTDVFNIEEWGGISYYLIDTSKHTEKEVQTLCKRNKKLESLMEIHDEVTPTLYSRDILSIIGKAGTLGEGFKQSLYVKNTDHGEETIAGTLGFNRQTFVHEQDRGEKLKELGYVEVMQGEKVVGYKKVVDLYTTEKLDKWKCICSIMPGAVSAFDQSGKVLGMFKISIIGPNQVPKGSFPILKYFDTENECKSFVSYCNTKFISFLYYLGCCGTTLTKEFFRFIPDPVNFDHIFTDQELYEKYNITKEEIEIIESIIKERK